MCTYSMLLGLIRETKGDSSIDNKPKLCKGEFSNRSFKVESLFAQSFRLNKFTASLESQQSEKKRKLMQ